MPSLYGYDLHFYNWNLKQLQTEKKFDEKQWYDVINGCKELENVIHEQRRLIDAGLEALPKPEGPFQAAPRKCELIVGEWETGTAVRLMHARRCISSVRCAMPLQLH